MFYETMACFCSLSSDTAMFLIFCTIASEFSITESVPLIFYPRFTLSILDGGLLARSKHLSVGSTYDEWPYITRLGYRT